VTYRTDFAQSAHRHFVDAEKLRAAASTDAAGYHYGFAAECALKLIVKARPDVDPTIRKHLSSVPNQDLRGVIRARLSGRRHGPIRTLLSMRSYFDQWDVEMRYAPNGTITAQKQDLWRSHARRTIYAAGIRT
jgi:hypothetical protein